MSAGASLHCEWGEAGVRSVGADADVVVIVDVLSFSTCVDVAVARGGRILPYSKQERGAADEFARQHGAVLAQPRGQGRFSLSPSTYLALEPEQSVVLPSPNGAVATLAARSASVLAGCLRNAAAVAAAAGARGPRILVVPAGECWPDGSLRPCLEDWLGAGAILSRMSGEPSDEARAAIAAYRDLRSELERSLHTCASGRELLERGYPDDVTLAAQEDVSTAVPEYDGLAFEQTAP